jgi:deoxycytidine triphosphate deaminase
VTIHLTAPKIDPGFDGHITLEMANFGVAAVELRAGADKPAQLMLLKLSTPLASGELYGTGERDTFQYQANPVPRKPPS